MVPPDYLTLSTDTRLGHKMACKTAHKKHKVGEKKGIDTRVESQSVDGCGHCGHEAPDLLVCLGCHSARYCSVAHQREAWLHFFFD